LKTLSEILEFILYLYLSHDYMIIWNEQAAQTLRKYINNTLETWKWTQFFLLTGPNWIWKIAHAKAIIEEILWWYMYSDCLFIQDYESFTWKTHTIPVEIKDENKRYIEFPDKTQHENYWVREMNEWLLNSSFSWKKFLLIENIQRMSNSAINAFLKSAEEPLANRFIIATVPHVSMVLDTIRSRCITIPFSILNNDDMQKFADENQIFINDKKLQSVIIAMAMWKPWFLINITKKIQQNEDLWENIKLLTSWLLDNNQPKWKLFQALKSISEQWLLNDFLEWWIAYCTDNWDIEQAERWIQMKKYLQSNVNQDSILLYGLMR